MHLLETALITTNWFYFSDDVTFDLESNPDVSCLVELTCKINDNYSFQIAVVMYRHFVHRNVTSMNFDNPVYRKTTEDQFALEKNGYAPGSKLYPSTVGEEVRALTAMECTLNIQNSLR